MEITQITTDILSDHLEACVALQKHLVTPGTPVDPQQFFATVHSDHSCFFGLFDEGALAGIGVVSKIVHPVRTNAYINNIIIDPAFRGKGYFNLLMDALEAKAREWGCTRAELTCSREEVQPLYAKRGYTKKDTMFFILPL